MKDKLVREWIESGNLDLEVAELLFSKKKYFNFVLFHLQQAVEKYLKGYLIYHGWKLRKIHDIEMLLTDAMKYDDSFTQQLDIGRRLTAFYFEDRCPPGPPLVYTKKEVKEILDKTKDMIKILADLLKDLK